MLFRRKALPIERPKTLTPRERVWNALTGKPVDRVPCVDVYFLPETIRQWEREGFPEGAEPTDVFDLDLVCVPVDCTMGWQEELVDETDEYRIVTGADGITRKEWKVYQTAPQELDFPVKQPRDWRAIRPALRAHEGRLPDDLEIRVAHAKERQRFLALAFLEPCTLARRLMGTRQWVEALQTGLPILDEILETGVRLILDTLDLALRRLSQRFSEPIVDGVWLHADLAYTHGAFMTDREYRSIVLPYHRQLTSELKRRKLTTFLYTQGNVATFLKAIRKSGFDAVLPLESFSQNDLSAYKRVFGQQVALGGNISADRLMESDEATEREVREKVTIGLGEQRSGYLFCVDRPIPPIVPLRRYQFALDLARGLSKA